jgi:hypothetical protein
MSYTKFIPSFHYVEPSKKLTPEWFGSAMMHCWYHGGCRGLLDHKDTREIETYAVGNYSMVPYRRMFKSQQKLINELNQNADYHFNGKEMPVDGFEQTPLINVKLNSARALVGKIKLDVEVKAQDPLAIRKKEEDIAFILNKPKLEAELNVFAEQMRIGKVDLGTTKNSAERYSDSPYGLDLNEPDELEVFDQMLYNLAVEGGLQSAIEGFSEIKNVNQIKNLEIKDQFYYGVSANFGFESAITGLPDAEYCYPGDIRVPYSALPDYNDNAYRFYEKRVTILELLNYSTDICLEDLDSIINDSGTGYCDCNGIKERINRDDFGYRKADLVLCMIKSIDFVGVAPLNKKSKFTYVVTDPEEAKKCETKIYGQNTYYAWWLKNTKYYFGIDKLGFAHREQGQECYQSFPINIFKSQEKSAVELSIGENKKAQIADIKMQHAIIMSLPAGRYIDVRFIRNYLAGTKEGITEESMLRVLNLALEKNIVLGDTEGFDGKNDGQFKSVIDLPGGLKTELIGYMQVIADANAKISMYTGINENLIGQKTEELVRNNQAAINAGLTALQYVQDAIAAQYQKLFSNWANVIRDCIERGGKSKEAIINLIGSKQVNLIDSLEDLPLHTMGIKVSLLQDQQWEARFNQELTKNEINGVIDTIDVYQLESVMSPKQKFGLLAVKIKQWKKREEKKRQEDFANQQAMLQQQGVNQQNAVNAKAQGEIKKIYTQGEVNAEILQLASSLGIQANQMDFLGKRALQQDRGNDQLEKNVKTLETKQTLENQKAFAP